MINPNPIASEAIFSATYVDNYIDSVENLPDDVQRQLSRIRDIDVQYRNHLRDVDHYHELWKTLDNSGGDNTLNRRARAIARMQASLILAQERGDEKMQIVNQLQEIIDQKTRQLDSDQRNLDIKDEQQLPLRDDDVAPTPPKVIRSQSPIRDVLTNTGSSSIGDVSGTSEFVSNEATTPTTERTAHNIAMAGTICCSGNGMQNSTSAQASNGTSPESQRSSTGKRSRRRHDTVNSQSQIDSICGTESNSASNETSGCSSGADKNALNNSGSMQHKTTINTGNATQKKPSLYCQVNAGGGLGAGNNGSIAAGSGTSMGASGSGNNSVKKKKRKARGAHATNSHNTREDTPPPDPDPIDPDEPTYCLCDQISFGEMILCDNDLCPIEWFHFSCVSLVLKPKGKWYCPNCRGDRPNIMKPKAQFLKELERYNKEKEEKT